MSEVEELGSDAAGGRRAQTRARLLDAARAAFEEKGWVIARVEDVVRHAGVSHGTFYTYFENKTAVLDALVTATQADMAALASAPWEADDVRGALDRVIGGFVDLYHRDAVVIRTWLQAVQSEAELNVRYRGARAAFVQRVADNLRLVTTRSGRSTGDETTTASALVSMVEHFTYCWAVLGEEHDREQAVRALVRIWGSTLNSMAGFAVVDLS